ncbi:MAG: hypothetical protein EOP53_10560 [Sphingobacteriales bacterium]|nr:MAG: hypothetical protein EOP53_10560 [Sphingobacteriales bacterium]
MKKICIHIIAGFISLQSCAGHKPVSSVITSVTPANNDSFRLEKIIPGSYTMMDVDVLNNLYLITAGNQLKKYNANGDSMAVFNDVKKYGNPTLMDVSNPLKVLLYYKNYATVVMLDRLLSQRNSINFRQKNIFSVKAIATSYDNNIWLFDEQDYKLKKIDEEGKLLQESTDWRVLMDPVPSPVRIIDNNNFVYLYDESKGFYVFDYYGTFKNNIPFAGWQHIAVAGGRITGMQNNKLHSYVLESLNDKTYTIPASFSNYISLKAMNGKVYVLKADALEIYSVL